MKKRNGVSFRTKLLSIVALACVICGAIAIAVAIYYNEKEFISGLVEKSKIIHGRLNVAAAYVASQGGLRPMIDRYVSKYKDPSELSEEDKLTILRQVPIYAAMKMGSENSEKDHYEFRVFSNEPRNKKNMATASELAIFKKFERDPSLAEFVSVGEISVTVYRPVRLDESRGCLNCHGDPSTSPWGNGKDILGYKMENWKDHKLHGVFAVTNNIETVIKAQTGKGGGMSSTTMLIILISIGGVVSVLVAAALTHKPLKNLNLLSEILSSAGEQVTSTSQQIAASAEDLSQSTTEQAASLQQTTASLEQISSMISKSSENAVSTASSSNDSQRSAEEGRAAVDRMLLSIDEISQSNSSIMQEIELSNQQMAEIVRVINDIGSKTRVINEIVFQTKLLSFNASVEAARAGEHGKGFAVVAEEIGSLAQMSGAASKEISSMLESSIEKVQRIADETKSKVGRLLDDGKMKLETGIEVAKSCSEFLNEIVDNVTKVSGLAHEISEASHEQSQGVSEINKAMSQLDIVTQRNATTSSEAAKAAEILERQAEKLKQAVDELDRTLRGRSVIATEEQAEPISTKLKFEISEQVGNFEHPKNAA